MFTITPAVFAGLPAHKPRILIVSLRDLGDALPDFRRKPTFDYSKSSEVLGFRAFFYPICFCSNIVGKFTVK